MKQQITTALLLFLSFQVFSQIQSPSEFLGYPLGSDFTYQHRVNAYFSHLADNSPNVTLARYGQSVEGRELFVVYISATKNIEDLEALRLNNLKAAKMESGTVSGKHLPICWLSYNIHGNESVGSESAMQVAYDLAAGKEGTSKWLEEVVVVIDPCENPDGRARYVNWYRQKTGNTQNPSPNDWEHQEPWPGGRYNHYLFDLNRDWAWQTQQESRARTQLYQKWMPHVHVDLHEMGYNSPYFFGPSAEPLHRFITPWQREFQKRSGKENARYFDEEGWLYFTEEVFDLLYPSYGDTWPTFQGAIGFTFEQGGSGRAGLAIETASGDTLTLLDRIEHHYAASLATVEATYKNRERLLQEHQQYFEDNLNNPVGEYKSYVIKNDPARKGDIAALLELLDGQKIQYGSVSAPKRYTGFRYLSRKKETFMAEAEDIMISAYQPQSRLLQVLFEPTTYYSDSLTYDLTAWAVPYIYDLETYALTEKVVPTEYALQDFEMGNIDPERPYAYVAHWRNFDDVKFLAQLMTKGIKVRFAQQPFQVGDQQFDRGSLIMTAFDNRHHREYFDSAVISAGNAFKKEITATSSGLTNIGIDFGSSSASYLKAPNVAIIGGDGVSPTAFGEVWFYFEEEIDYPVTVIDTDYFNQVDDLRAYDVVILPSGRYGGMRSTLLDYVRSGGKLIAIERALETFARGNHTLLGKMTAQTSNGEQDSFIANLTPYASRARERLTSGVEGSIFEVKLDATHPLAYGQDGHFFLMKRNNHVYQLLPEGGWNVGIFTEGGHVSGFVGHKLKAKLPNTLSIGLEEKGRGQLIYFSDSPIIRSFWNSGKLLLGNAIFFAGED